MNKERLCLGLEALGIAADDTAIERFSSFHTLLDTANTRMDLTAVPGEDERVDRHDLDSVAPLAQGLLPHGAHVIDVGTGAGFPGMPLLILRPDLRMTFLDAQQKRVRFLREALLQLGLQAETLHGRAEDAARSLDQRERYDIALSRAVASAPVLQELTLPFLRVGGLSIAWKGPGLAEEMDGARRAAHLLGGKVRAVVPAPVPGREEWAHVLLLTDKVAKTPPAYPRRAGLPAKKPLACEK